MLPVLISATMPGSKWDIRDSEMKILTNDPDWARDIYEPRALAMMFVRKHGWLESDAASLAVIEELASIGGHRFNGLMTAFRTRQGRFQLDAGLLPSPNTTP